MKTSGDITYHFERFGAAGKVCAPKNYRLKVLSSVAGFRIRGFGPEILGFLP